MRRIEIIRNMTNEEVADLFCRMQEGCNKCVACEYCRPGHTGFIDWLEQEDPWPGRNGVDYTEDWHPSCYHNE